MLSDDDEDEDADELNNEGDTFGNFGNDLDMDVEDSIDLDPNPQQQTQRPAPAIPSQLIARLLHEHFTQTDTRVTKDARDVLCKYVEVFAQEAIARACFGKDEGGGGGMEGDFLEVSEWTECVGRGAWERVLGGRERGETGR